MTKKDIKEILELHGRWLDDDDNGEKADLRGADLRSANLIEANLFRADLTGAILTGADLYEADLYGASLREADLRNTNLCRANLYEANLYGALLSGANLCGADLPERVIQVGPIGSRKDYTIYWADRDIVQCGSWNHYNGGSLEEFKKRIDEVYPEGQYRKEYLAAIAMFEVLKNG